MSFLTMFCEEDGSLIKAGSGCHHSDQGGTDRSRYTIGPNDTAIAGHVIAAGAILVTKNMREFERVPDLVLEDWLK